MAVTLEVGDGESAGAEDGSVHLDRATMDELDVETGDAVEVRGTRPTVARVGTEYTREDEEDASEADAGEAAADGSGTAADGSGTARVFAGADVLENAGVDVGESVQVTRVLASPAESVTLAPTRSVSIEGSKEAIMRVLAGRPLSEGDETRVTLFGGSMTVPFVVEETVPAGPVEVVDGTTVTIRKGTGSTTAGKTEGQLPEVTFDDVGGLEEAVAQLRQLAETPLKRPELFDRLGATTNGVLLYGPSGSGKTMLAAALANEVDASVFAVTDPGELAEYADGDRSIAGIVDSAIASAPSLIVVDDLDALAPPREDAGGRQARVVQQLLSAMDRLSEHDDVVVVATTNRVDAVDPTLRRGGRFDREIEVGVPDRAGRLAILERLLVGVPVTEDVDVRELATRTHGFVGADLRALVAEATRNAIERLPPAVTLGDTPVSEEILSKVGLTGGDFERAMEDVEPSAMRDVAVERPTVTFDDVGGLEEAKRQLLRSVEWPLRYPDVFDRIGVQTPQGVLLYGPPGTGKTLLVKAVANASDANFLSVNGPELLNKYVGESERGVREVFDTARQNAPTVVFFDEVDAIASERGGGGSDSGVIERVVSQLLTELDGLRERTDVFVVGATNRPDILDPALLRPGRFEKLVEVAMPDRDTREAIFEVHTRGLPLVGIDAGELADRTDGFTGSDVEATVREATLLALEDYMRTNADAVDAADTEGLEVTEEHFEQALSELRPSVSAEMREKYREISESL